MAEKEKLTRKEKRLRWKEAKRARRQAEKDYYQYAHGSSAYGTFI